MPYHTIPYHLQWHVKHLFAIAIFGQEMKSIARELRMRAR